MSGHQSSSINENKLNNHTSNGLNDSEIENIDNEAENKTSLKVKKNTDIRILGRNQVSFKVEVDEMKLEDMHYARKSYR